MEETPTRKKSLEPYHDRLIYDDECEGCGNRKKLRQSFCPSCFNLLPNDMQRALYRLIGRGYRRSYDAALKYLNAMKEPE